MGFNLPEGMDVIEVFDYDRFICPDYKFMEHIYDDLNVNVS